MRDFHTLIKVQKFHLDQQRQVLAARQAEADAIIMAIAMLQANLETEKARAAANPEANINVGIFIKAELERHIRLQSDLSAKEREIDVEREKLALLFEELKRYEIAQETRDREARAEEEKQENFELDELGGQRHHKNKEN